MITTGKGLYIDLPIDENYFLQFIKFMRQAPPNGPGWKIAGSCNNITGTMGVDVINDINDIVTGTWVVLESPDRMVQLMFHIYTTDAHRVYYNPNSDYAGGGVGAIPTTSTADYLFYQGNVIDATSTPGGLHILAEETFPYNFAVCCYSYNSNTVLGGMLFVRFDSKHPLMSDHIMTVDIEMFDRSRMIDNNGAITQPNPALKAVFDGEIVACSMTAIKGTNSSSLEIYPDDGGYRANGMELFIPTVWTASGNIAGTTNFVRWTANSRSGIHQYANRSIISHNRIAFPWDGLTIPATDPKTAL